MLCLDSSILIRCITQDDKIQSPKALSFLKKALASKEGVYIPDVIVIECAWLLQKLYHFSPSAISSALEPLLMEAKVRFDHPGRIHHALSLFSAHAISITDAYLAAAAADTPGAFLVTFDKKLKSLSPNHIEP